MTMTNPFEGMSWPPQSKHVRRELAKHMSQTTSSRWFPADPSLHKNPRRPKSTTIVDHPTTLRSLAQKRMLRGPSFLDFDPNRSAGTGWPAPPPFAPDRSTGGFSTEERSFDEFLPPGAGSRDFGPLTGASWASASFSHGVSSVDRMTQTGGSSQWSAAAAGRRRGNMFEAYPRDEESNMFETYPHHHLISDRSLELRSPRGRTRRLREQRLEAKKQARKVLEMEQEEQETTVMVPKAEIKQRETFKRMRLDEVGREQVL